MDRRTFNRRAALLGAIAPLASLDRTTALASRRKPNRLRTGQTVGLISPGSYLDDAGFEKALRNIESLGLNYRLGKHVRERRGYLAGTDEQRIDDLHRMFADDSVDAVWCLRGGYGCTRLLPHLDYDLIKKNPKILIGYSDITALLVAIHQRTGLVCFHGPVAASEFTEYTRGQIRNVLFDASDRTVIPYHDSDNPAITHAAYVIRSGKMNGELMGGNLSLVSAMAGTPYEWCTKKNLLFLEDIGEKPYRIDRMLVQLRQSGELNRASGIICGIFADCEAKDETTSLTLKQTLTEQLAPLNIPVVYGFSFGHIANQCTLPIGVKSSFDTERFALVLEESPFTD